MAVTLFGLFEVAAEPAYSGTTSLLGDANCDSSLNAIDAALVLQLDAGLVGSLACFEEADVDHDSDVDSIDAALIIQRIAELLFAFPAIIRVEVGGAQPIPVGQEFRTDILVEHLEHLAGFDFTLAFDPGAVELKRIEDSGLIFENSERDSLVCDHIDEDGQTSVFCNSLGAPRCLGGPSGPSGSGLLGSVVFTALAEGVASLELPSATLVYDDVRPCDPPDFDVKKIPNRREGSTVEIGAP